MFRGFPERNGAETPGRTPKKTMPTITISAYVPADAGSVFSHVTGFPVQGAPDLRLLQDKYGTLEVQEGQRYTFRENSEAATLWLYTFEPPHRRLAQDVETNWSDRIDTFEAADEGTIWTITWQPKAKGAPFLLRWLFFRWQDRKKLYDQMMKPVVDHFGKQEFY